VCFRACISAYYYALLLLSFARFYCYLHLVYSIVFEQINDDGGDDMDASVVAVGLLRGLLSPFVS